jgi:hypothetical protein
MKIRRKLLITFTLAGGVVAIVGASGIEPLLRISRAAAGTPIDISAVELQRAFTLTYTAAAMVVMLSLLTTLRLVNRLMRFRREAENMAKGLGEAIRIEGEDEIDLIAIAFNEFHGTLKNLEAKLAAKRLRRQRHSLDVRRADRGRSGSAHSHREQSRLRAARIFRNGTARPADRDAVQGRADAAGDADPRSLRNNATGDFEATYRTRSGG